MVRLGRCCRDSGETRLTSATPNTNISNSSANTVCTNMPLHLPLHTVIGRTGQASISALLPSACRQFKKRLSGLPETHHKIRIQADNQIGRMPRSIVAESGQAKPASGGGRGPGVEHLEHLRHLNFSIASQRLSGCGDEKTIKPREPDPLQVPLTQACSFVFTELVKVLRRMTPYRSLRFSRGSHLRIINRMTQSRQ